METAPPKAPTPAEAATELIDIVGHQLARHEDGRNWAKHAEPLVRADGSPDKRARLLSRLGALAQTEGSYDDARTALLDFLREDHPPPSGGVSRSPVGKS